ncbi:virulence-associated E family protein, partial [Crocinitomicaceae bacterium]|nr:virulence-associated E family protein [Crocinitomicaceae bacterium]
RLTKRFWLDDEGQIHKDSQPVFANGTAETQEISKLSDIESVIKNLGNNECISTGLFDVPKCEIVTTEQLDQDRRDAGIRSRSKDCMTQPSPGLVLLDHDPSPWMPKHLRCASPKDLMAKLENAMPELSSLGYSGTTSCSAGVFNTETNAPYLWGGGFHVYLAMERNDLGALQRYLEVRLWNAGFGFIAFARNGAMLVRCILDVSVLSPERLIYEADPVLGDGLSRKPREWQHRDGPALSGDLQLTVEEIAEYDRRVSKTKADPKAIEEAERLQDAYHADRIHTVVKQKSITEAEAKKLLPRQSIAERESAKRWLHPYDVIEINGELITVTELLERGSELDCTAIPDPIEGRDYGATTAKFFWNDGKNPCIHSFAHGLNVTYQLGLVAARALVVKPKSSATVDLVQPIDPSGFPHRRESPSGQISLPATIENVEHMLNAYDIRVRYDVIKKKLSITIPGLSGSPENFSNVAINNIISLATLNGISTGQLANYIDALGDKHQVNPVADWIMSKPWDGIDRLEDIYATLHTRDDYPKELKQALVYRWLLSATAAALKPSGFYGRGVLTLQGPQGIGKTSWIRNLISDPILQENVLLLGHHLDAGSKDSLVTAVSHWVVEIGELDSSFRKDVARLKGFITGDKDKVRRPYARTDSEYQRRTVFCASVNEENFLIDPTGNTRWWTIPVVSIDYMHDIDMQQVFAQLARDLDQGAQWWLTKDEEALLETQNRHHRAVSSIEERVLSALNLEMAEDRWVNKSATETLQAIGIPNPSNPQCRECGGILRDHFGPPKKIQGVYKWRLPLKTEHSRFP